MYDKFARSRAPRRILLALTIPLALGLAGVLLVHASPREVVQRPLPPPAASTGTIAGTVTYSGSVTGTHMVWVGAFTTTQGGPPQYAAVRMGTGPYTITGVAEGVYHIMAGMDADDSGGDPNPSIDPLGMYAQNPLTVPAGELVEGVDVALQDPSGPPPGGGGIAGRITYSGRLSSAHNIIVFAALVGSEGPPGYATVIFDTGSYTITNVAAGDYFVGAFMDMGGDMGPPEPGEPFGWHDPSSDGRPDEVTVAGGNLTAEVDITLRDTLLSVFLPAILSTAERPVGEGCASFPLPTGRIPPP